MASCLTGQNCDRLEYKQDASLDITYLSDLRGEINQTKIDVSSRFAEYHNSLYRKEISVIAQLDELIETYEKGLDSTREQLEQLERAREENIQIFTLNSLNDSLEEVLATLDSNICELREKTLLPLNVEVAWQDEGMNDLIENVCSIQGIERKFKADYEQRKEPFWSGCNRGSGAGELRTSDVFRYGLGLDVDKNQSIYIADLWNNRILVFSKRGVYEREFGTNILKKPYSVHVCKESIYVSEWGNDCVTEFDLLGNKVRRVGTHGNSHGKFNRPAGITTDVSGVVYVCDRNNNRVQKFDKQLVWLETIRQQLIEDPSDVKVSHRELFVLAICKSSKSWLSPLNCCNTIFVLSLEEGELLRTITNQRFVSGRFFCLDNTGHLLISDSQLGGIIVLSPDGELVAVLGSEVEEVTMKPYCYQSKGIAFCQDVIVNVCYKSVNCLQMF